MLYLYFIHIVYKQSMKNLVQNPPQVYAEEVTVHMSSYADR